ncbi:MAG: LysM peptidoglycan-binding domain-containing protein [Marinoscillum sp.]
MRLLFVGLLSLTVFFAQSGSASIPQVPSSIEIVGVKLKITSDAQSEIQKSVNALRASDMYFRIKLDRVNLYFPIVERVLKEEGVPEDLKYLAIQESALISDAISSSDAVGYWQFKDFTAREVGLRVDSKVDERKNIVSATRGAAKYFKRNNFFFKNWIYAVSAYQAGPGGAKRYVDKENFGSDKLTITSKTHWYVLKYIAHVIAFKDEIGAPHSEGLKLAEYTKGEGKSIDQIARELKSDEELTNEYNKWIKGKIPDDKEYTVIIPLKGKLPKNLEKEDTDSSPPPLSRTIKDPQPTVYPEKITGGLVSRQTIFFKVNGKDALMASPNDNLKSLAEKSGLDPDTFLDYNDLNAKTTIKSGEIYYADRKRNRSSIHYHVAQHNESLWDISQKYGVKLDKLAKKNDMSPNDLVTPGRLMWLRKNKPNDQPVEYHKVDKPKEIKEEKPKPIETRKPVIITKEPEPEKVEQKKVPEKAEVVEKPDGQRILHVIQPGETLWSISKKYDVTVQNITSWNNLDQSSTVSPGLELTVYSNKTELNEADRSLSEKEKPDIKEKKDEEPSPKSNSHEVQPGESLWGISRKYGTTVEQIRAWNKLGPNDPIQPGQFLVISGSDKTVPVSNEQKYDTYQVRGGDSLYKIAREHDMTVEEIMELNNLSSSSLSVGDKIRVIKK